MENIYKWLIAAGGSVITYLYGQELPAILGVLVALVVLDIISGLAASGFEGKIKSSIGFRGIAKKIYLFLLIAVGHLIDQTIGDGHLVRDAAIYFFIVNEVISVIENGGRLGVPIPPVFEKAIEVLKNKGGGKSE